MGIKETVYFEGKPHIGDLIINLVMGLTIICLPLTVGAVIRALWLRYRITDRRVSVTGGWRGSDRTDVVYKEITKINKVPRGLGFWGDIVITLEDGSRLEMRSVPKFREVFQYMAEKTAARSDKSLEAITA